MSRSAAAIPKQGVLAALHESDTQWSADRTGATSNGGHPLSGREVPRSYDRLSCHAFVRIFCVFADRLSISDIAVRKIGSILRLLQVSN